MCKADTAVATIQSWINYSHNPYFRVGLILYINLIT